MSNTQEVAGDTPPVELNISAEKVFFIIVKAREFDVKVDPVEPDPASNAADDGERAILEDYDDDPTQAELVGAIASLNDDEVVDLIALAWVGRGDYDASEWAEARALAFERHREKSARYLIGIPTLGDFLEEGLAALGHSVEEFEVDRL
ncbi:MAG: DUF3775 domain-containing protein [Azospirillaceae bacterium]|nr:DUF3775 domain-containing protein [Azospirillaceae bacterium]